MYVNLNGRTISFSNILLNIIFFRFSFEILNMFEQKTPLHAEVQISTVIGE